MKIVSYSTKHYDRKHMEWVNQHNGYHYDIEYFDFNLTEQTAKMPLALMLSVFSSMTMQIVRFYKNLLALIYAFSHYAARVLIMLT